MVLRNSVNSQYLYAMIFGYARVSTDDQDTAAQIRALNAAGCERIFSEKASGGSRWKRPELTRMIEQLRPDDIVVVWKLDRFSRSLADLIFLLEQITNSGASFRSLTEALDTTGPAGRMMVHILGAFAEYERSMIVERTRAGMEEARAQGRLPGRRPSLTVLQQEEVIEIVKSGRKSASSAARLFGVAPSTITRLLKKAEH